MNADYFVVDVYRADASATPQAAEYLGASGCIDTLTTGIFNNQLVTVPQGTLSVGGKVVVTATAFTPAHDCHEGTSELSPGSPHAPCTGSMRPGRGDGAPGTRLLPLR